MTAPTAQKSQSGPNLELLGLKSPMEVIDILGALKIDGAPLIADDKAFLNPQLKAELVLTYFKEKFNVTPNKLPYIAAVIKKELKSGKLRWET